MALAFLTAPIISLDHVSVYDRSHLSLPACCFLLQALPIHHDDPAALTADQPADGKDPQGAPHHLLHGALTLADPQGLPPLSLSI